MNLGNSVSWVKETRGRVQQLTSSWNGVNVERRQAVRFPLHLAVGFFWKDEQGVRRGGDGRSRDLSTHGVYVRSGVSPEVGANLDLSILLPKLPRSVRVLEMQAKGRVVRVEGTLGFAVKAHKLKLHEAEDIFYGVRSTENPPPVNRNDDDEDRDDGYV
ncbi:MAG TPA: PilZ domain-containing protein [Candidatus Acidoferrales bacterium]|nr:PilZ domain-containing protein [Candidatus Acidoferrales bacterium]